MIWIQETWILNTGRYDMDIQGEMIWIQGEMIWIQETWILDTGRYDMDTGDMDIGYREI